MPKELLSRMGRAQGAHHRESLSQVSQVAIAITFKKGIFSISLYHSNSINIIISIVSLPLILDRSI